MNVAIFHGYADVLIPKPEPKPILEAIEQVQGDVHTGGPDAVQRYDQLPRTEELQPQVDQRVLLGRCPTSYGDHEDFREAYRGSNL